MVLVNLYWNISLDFQYESVETRFVAYQSCRDNEYLAYYQIVQMMMINDTLTSLSYHARSYYHHDTSICTEKYNMSKHRRDTMVKFC